MAKLTISTILLSIIIQIKANRLLQKVACTQDAKICPDGSFVSRTGPNCEFTKCPPCEVAPCLLPPCPFTKCPGDNPCLKEGKCDVVANCFADPCISNPCPTGKVCTADYCGGCNFNCETDCSNVFCVPPVCTAGQTLVTVEGDCCPSCQLDCSKVLCLKPVCKEGYELVVAEGQCCPVCKRYITTNVCPDPNTMEFVQCKGCPATCDNINPLCLMVCVPGCRCKKETRIWSEVDGKCITVAECGPDCSLVRCAEAICEGNEVAVIPDGACCAICEANGDKVECRNIADCEEDYKCKRDPKCRNLNGFEKFRCARESETKKVCWRKQQDTICPMDECDMGYQCVGIKNGNGICVDYQ